MYLTMTAPIAFPVMLGQWERGLGATSPLPVSTMAEDSAATALTAAAAIPSPATPFLLAAAGIAKLLATLGVGSGCGQTCIQATNVVNQAEPALLANIQQYENGEITQEQAQATYSAIMQGLQVSCSAIPGQAGQDCWTDRQAGSCKWKQTTDSPLLGYPGEPQPGDCWDWVSGYGTPLTLPPLVATSPAASSVGSAISTVSSDASAIASSVGLPSGMGSLLLMVAAIAALMVIL
jgi:hypothetical protein